MFCLCLKAILMPIVGVRGIKSGISLQFKKLVLEQLWLYFWFCTLFDIIIRTHYKTRIFIIFESSTFNVCKHLTDLNYASDFYKIEIKPTILSLEQFIYLATLSSLTKLIIPISDKIYIYPHELRRTARLLANESHPLMILANQKNKHIDVIHLTNVLSGTDSYPISALVHMEWHFSQWDSPPSNTSCKLWSIARCNRSQLWHWSHFDIFTLCFRLLFILVSFEAVVSYVTPLHAYETTRVQSHHSTDVLDC